MNKSTQMNQKARNFAFYVFALGVSAILLAAPDTSWASTGSGASSAFDDIWQLIHDLSVGTLGKSIAGAFILVGIVAGIVRQSIMAFVVGIGAGLALNYAPDVIDGLFTATLPLSHLSPALIQAAAQIGNGLGM